MISSVSGLFRSIWTKKGIYLYILPTFVLLGTFMYWPFLLAFFRSLFEWDGVTTGRFVGIGNYVQILTDPVFHKCMRNVGIIFGFSLTLPLIGPLIAAEAIYNLRSDRLQRFMRIALIIPSTLPVIVNLMLIQYIFNPQVGFANALLRVIGVQEQTWFADTRLALPTLLILGAPWSGGLWMLVYLAGLQAISTETIDASVIDGANTFQRIVYIDVPHVVGQIKLSLIATAIGVLQGFAHILVLTDGGPYNATNVPGLYMFHKAFEWRYPQMGYGCAVGVVMFLMIILLTVFFMKYVSSGTETRLD